MCDCIERTNAALATANSNTKLEIPITFNFSGKLNAAEHVLIATVKADPKNRTKPMRLFASYCPFCGQKYPEP